MIADPIGVSPVVSKLGAWNMSAVWKSCTTRTGPKVMMATSTRCAAIWSDFSSCSNVRSPAFSSAIGLPRMEPEVSSNNRQGQRGSEFRTRSLGTMTKGT